MDYEHRILGDVLARELSESPGKLKTQRDYRQAHSMFPALAICTSPVTRHMLHWSLFVLVDTRVDRSGSLCYSSSRVAS